MVSNQYASAWFMHNIHHTITCVIFGHKFSVEYFKIVFSMGASWTLRHSVKASSRIFVGIVIDVSKRMQATDGKAILVGIKPHTR